MMISDGKGREVLLVATALSLGGKEVLEKWSWL
jgi:hypothetical protein